MPRPLLTHSRKGRVSGYIRDLYLRVARKIPDICSRKFRERGREGTGHVRVEPERAEEWVVVALPRFAWTDQVRG